MYDLHLTAEQIEIRDTVRDFVRNELRPVTLHPSRLEPFDKPLLTGLLSAASKMGLRTLTMSEESGGAGADGLTSCLVMEELAQGDVGIAAVLAHTSTLARLVFDELMSSGQRAAFLPRFMDDAESHLAFAGRDAESGLAASYHRPSTAPAAQAKATRQASGDWQVAGTFAAVANAPVAKLFAVEAETPEGSSILLIPRETAGLIVKEGDAGVASSEPGVIRWRHGSAGRVILQNCMVPAANRLGAAGTGAAAVSFAASYFARSGLQLAAANIGVGQTAYEAAIDYAKLRRQGARSIIEHQAIGTLLADAAIRLEAARTLVWKAAWALEHPDAVSDRSLSALPLHLIARTYAAEAMIEVTERSAECFGAMGVMRDMPMQQYVGDALVFKHSGAGHGASKLLIAEAVAGFERTR